MRAKCMAHGDEQCTDCSRISAEYLIDDGPACRSCDYWGKTGMHWDTCAGRIRGPVAASEKIKPEESVVDMVNSPPHYRSSPATVECVNCGERTTVECIDVTRHMNFNIGNVYKYCWRLGLKGDPVEQLKKAVFYLQDEIKRLGGTP